MSTVVNWNVLESKHGSETRSAVTIATRLLSLAPMLSGIHDDESYKKGLALYESILAALPEEGIGENSGGETDALVWLEQVLGRALSEYSEKCFPLRSQEGDTPMALLRVIMDENELNQSDLPEIGTQGVVSEILSGKRKLNVRQIRAISHRFDIPQRYFLED